jgi:hypothetical protein
MRLAGTDYEALAKQVEEAVRSLSVTPERAVDAQRTPPLSAGSTRRSAGNQ